MMRSLGFTRTEIRRLFVAEMLALASLAVVFGGIVGALGIFGVNAAGIHINPPGVAGGLELKLVPNAQTIMGAAVVIFFCEARETPLPAETGRPSPLINRPDCGIGEFADERPCCFSGGWVRAKSRSLH